MAEAVVDLLLHLERARHRFGAFGHHHDRRRIGHVRGAACSRWHSSSMSNGTSGIRTAVAPPAMPAWVAIQPVWRPITSTTITRSWLSAVVCSRSIASVAIWTAVLNPNVRSVPSMSLSMVLGTPTIGSPCSAWSRQAIDRLPFPPMTISASRPRSLEGLADPVDSVGRVERAAPPCAQIPFHRVAASRASTRP